MCPAPWCSSREQIPSGDAEQPEGSGWSWTPLDEHFDLLWTVTEPLPLPELADPDDVAATALLLLAGDDDGFTTGTRLWGHAGFQAKALTERHRQETRP
ncbi:hypothetical protein ACFVUN_34790 [Kitasatospora griseola]|uniref:hypothetical protein n=1 Tax=Kitasatospora griseola TaxID=2064 RepID=UPI0036D9310B